MFVNDIPSIVSSPAFMFADDTKIIHYVMHIDDHTALQKHLRMVGLMEIKV